MRPTPCFPDGYLAPQHNSTSHSRLRHAPSPAAASARLIRGRALPSRTSDGVARRNRAAVRPSRRRRRRFSEVSLLQVRPCRAGLGARHAWEHATKKPRTSTPLVPAAVIAAAAARPYYEKKALHMRSVRRGRRGIGRAAGEKIRS
eukprot:362426-Chlamydomonas_euryale.AAC.3